MSDAPNISSRMHPVTKARLVTNGCFREVPLSVVGRQATSIPLIASESKKSSSADPEAPYSHKHEAVTWA